MSSLDVSDGHPASSEKGLWWWRELWSYQLRPGWGQSSEAAWPYQQPYQIWLSLSEGKSNPHIAWLFSNLYPFPPPSSPHSQFTDKVVWVLFFYCRNIPFTVWIISDLANSQLPLWQHLAKEGFLEGILMFWAGRNSAFLVRSSVDSNTTSHKPEALYLKTKV